MEILETLLKSLELEEPNERPTLRRERFIRSRKYCPNNPEIPEYTDSNQSPEPSQLSGNKDYSSNTLSDEMKNVTISVPKARFSSSLDRTIVDDQKGKKTSLAVTFTEDQEQPVYCQEGTTTENIGSSSGEKRKGKEEATVMTINYTVVDTPLETGRWIKHYSSSHRILLVGEGDFSFSTCLAAAFGFAPNMIATSLDSQDFLLSNYPNALGNILALYIRKCQVLHEIDATKMASHLILGRIAFDRIVFNFPFAGFFKYLPREPQLELHRYLVNLFRWNAKQMLSPNGEIHITHKTNGFHREWGVESIASAYGLRLIEAVDFNGMDYPGYNTKRGFGGDENFNCYPSKTYKFGL